MGSVQCPEVMESQTSLGPVGHVYSSLRELRHAFIIASTTIALLHMWRPGIAFATHLRSSG
jgi:hypothetical protein